MNIGDDTTFRERYATALFCVFVALAAGLGLVWLLDGAFRVTLP